MKKSLIALAVMAAAGAASAQSSVTLFGTVDLTLNRTSGRVTEVDAAGVATTSRSRITQLTRNGYNSSRLGFRGTEDLGGGMSASFWLEGDFNPDDGLAGNTTSANNISTAAQSSPRGSGFNFNRRATVSLAGGWGEVRLGRDFNPTYYNVSAFDPFGTNGIGTTLTATGGSALIGTTFVRTSNMVSYFTPANLGGFYGQAAYWFGEQTRTDVATARDGDGNGYGLRAGFASGPFNVAIALSRTEDDVDGDTRTWNIGGQWDFGVARAMAQYTRDKRESVTAGFGDEDGRGWLVGALVPVGAGEIRVSYSQYRGELAGSVGGVAFAGNERARQIALGYVHNLSKRTALYGTIAQIRGRGAEVVGGTTTGRFTERQTGFDLGIRHAF